MVKKYVKGRSSNPEGVIKALENLGGVNTCYHKGDNPNKIYFINDMGTIFCASEDSVLGAVIFECFEEIQPAEPTPKVITNIDVTKWYFKMIHEGHAVQFKLRENSSAIYNYLPTYEQDDAENYTWVRIDFGEWIPIEEAGIV